jgi:hypothetical protein
MDDGLVVQTREERPPLWAVLAPPLYLFACALCVRAFAMDRSMDIGIAGLLVAVGLAPAFSLPAIFSTRGVRLGASNEGLLVDGRLVKINNVQIARADRGAARLIVETRDGATRTFIAPRFKEAQLLMSRLPPISAPTGLLAA